MTSRTILAASILLLFPAFCCGTESAAPPSPSLPKGHPQIAAPQQATAPLRGKVLKTMNSGGYTYIRLQKKDGTKIWVAIPTTKVTVGKTVDLVPGSELKNFKSQTLNRTFDSITFSLGLASKQPKKEDNEVLMATRGSKGARVAAEKVSVRKATGTNTHTIAELFAQKGQLDGKKVVVRGKVVKVTPRIMKMTWIHLQDGTGTPGRNNHDLVVRTKTLPAVGDTVKVSGVLLKDKDFGSGYKYEVLIDDAEVTK